MFYCLQCKCRYSEFVLEFLEGQARYSLLPPAIFGKTHFYLLKNMLLFQSEVTDDDKLNGDIWLYFW